MENLKLLNHSESEYIEHDLVLPITNLPVEVSTDNPFIQANTTQIPFSELNEQHIIPVFIKDNEPVISCHDFISVTSDVVQDIYGHETILSPNIRVSHPIKGRVPEARNKPANELLEHEKTLYYERMAFIIEIPTIYDVIDGNRLSLTVGGVKSYHLDNLNSKKGSDEHFKVFIGFKNQVCTNLCVWSDGLYADLKVTSIGQLKALIKTLLEKYNPNFHLRQMELLTKYHLTEHQFATLIGRCRMYQHLSYSMKKDVTPMLLGDSQIGMICKDYYKDCSFCKNEDGTINLWKLYNLFTGANKSTYIDSFLDRSVNAYHFIEQIRFALQNQTNNWYLN
ncbi:MAG: hypothetical protein B7Y37_08840 [Sphingobacteriia bacterium 28-36-52]|nr:MAG: hypothetical protein B7Y37_08840 [Sphingobacteriia bacterium 28-36-52]